MVLPRKKAEPSNKILKRIAIVVRSAWHFTPGFAAVFVFHQFFGAQFLDQLALIGHEFSIGLAKLDREKDPPLFLSQTADIKIVFGFAIVEIEFFKRSMLVNGATIAADGRICPHAHAAGRRAADAGAWNEPMAAMLEHMPAHPQHFALAKFR